jgi:hypothetical protein
VSSLTFISALVCAMSIVLAASLFSWCKVWHAQQSMYWSFTTRNPNTFVEISFSGRACLVCMVENPWQYFLSSIFALGSKGKNQIDSNKTKRNYRVKDCCFILFL